MCQFLDAHAALLFWVILRKVDTIFCHFLPRFCDTFLLSKSLINNIVLLMAVKFKFNLKEPQ